MRLGFYFNYPPAAADRWGAMGRLAPLAVGLIRAHSPDDELGLAVAPHHGFAAIAN